MVLTTSISLKELVDRVTPAGVDRAVVERRIRHWTGHGILPTEGAAFPGQGKSRKYSEEIIYLAAVLNELAKYGIPLAGIAAAYAAISFIYIRPAQVSDFVTHWERAKSQTGPVLLSFSMEDPGADGRVRAKVAFFDAMEATNPFFDSGGVSVLSIKLTDLFRPLKR
jgi:hypothetical protein